MNELLSRVKELQKLNPKFDKKTKTLIVVKTGHKTESLKKPSSCGTGRIEDLRKTISGSTGKATITTENNALKENTNEEHSAVPQNTNLALNSNHDNTAQWKSKVWHNKANTLLRNGILNNSKSRSPDLVAFNSKLSKKTQEALDGISERRKKAASEDTSDTSAKYALLSRLSSIRASKGIKAISSKKALTSTSEPGTKLPNKKLSSDGLTKFLQLKVAVLQEELEGCSKGLTKKTGKLKRSYDTRKKLEAQLTLTISKNNILTEQIAKLEDKLAASARMLKEREVEFSETNRELESLKKEYGVMTQLNTNLERKLYKVNEDLENIKNNISSLKEAEHGLKASTRQEVEAQERKIRRLKKQRSELVSSYKKYSSMHYQPLDELSYLQRS